MTDCRAAIDHGHCPPVCEYYRRAHAAGWDAGHNNMKANGRTEWNRMDLKAAGRVCNDAFNSICPRVQLSLAQSEAAWAKIMPQLEAAA